ncbi:MAG: ferritin-like domain-containing protein [Clostridia bacterium]|nr:ferritin-like domain-containing protein [Clostridia bacterium]
MAQITCKELSSLSDLLGAEQLIINKYESYANQTTDTALKNKYEQMAKKHQQHFETLYAQLK